MRSRPPWRCTASSPHGAKRRDRLGPSLSPPPSEKRRRHSLLELESADAGLGHRAGPPSSEAEAVPARSPSLSQLRRKAGPDQAPARSERVSDSGHSAGGGPTRTAGAEARGRPRVRARAATRAEKGGISEGLNHSDLPSADVPHATWRIRRSPARACRPVRAAPPAHGAPSPTRAPNRSPRFALRGPKAEARRRPRPRCAPAAHPLAASPSPSSPRSPGAARTRRLWATIRRRSP
jgi:hypothetical protein